MNGSASSNTLSRCASAASNSSRTSNCGRCCHASSCRPHNGLTSGSGRESSNGSVEQSNGSVNGSHEKNAVQANDAISHNYINVDFSSEKVDDEKSCDQRSKQRSHPAEHNYVNMHYMHNYMNVLPPTKAKCTRSSRPQPLLLEEPEEPEVC